MDDLTAAVARAIRRTVEYQGGVAFAVPADARDSHLAALAEAAMSQVQPQIDDLRAENERLRYDLDETRDFWTDLANAVLENAPEEWDDDVAGDAIAVRYVRHLESEVDRLGGSRFPWEDEDDALAALDDGETP